jgi:hypothetical protein
MQKENDRVLPPWGDDMEKALMAQGEAVRKRISVPRRRWLLRCRSTTLRGLRLIIAILLAWFFIAFAMRYSHAAKFRAIRTDLDRSARQGITRLRAPSPKELVDVAKRRLGIAGSSDWRSRREHAA